MTAPQITPGVNSYISIEDADDIAVTRLFAGHWNAATAAQDVCEGETPPPDIRPLALITATTILDRLKWDGQRTDPAQPLAWPRQRVRDEYRRCIPDDETPTALATACAELAFHLLGQTSHSEAAVQMRQLGDSLVMYFPTVADELPKRVRRLIEPFLSIRSAHSAELLF